MPKRKTRKTRKNPAPHELIMAGASILGAVGNVARLMVQNPRDKKSMYRARLHQLLTQGLPGPVASDQARKELGYRNNPLTKEEQKKLEKLAEKHIKTAESLQSQREKYYNYGVASGYTRAAGEFGERQVNYLPPRVKSNPLLAVIGNPGKISKEAVAEITVGPYVFEVSTHFTHSGREHVRGVGKGIHGSIRYFGPSFGHSYSPDDFLDYYDQKELLRLAGKKAGTTLAWSEQSWSRDRAKGSWSRSVTSMGKNPKTKRGMKTTKAKTTKTKALPRKKNFDGPRIKPVGKTSIDKIIDLPGFDEAYKRFKKFHDSEPTEVVVYEVPDGIDASKVVLTLGQVPEMHYVTPLKNSNKNGYHWVHKTAKGKEPVHLYNPLTDEHIIVPPHLDGMRVTDWLREHNE